MKIIILGAGKSTRFKSNKHKALHDLLGKTVLERVLDTCWSLNPLQIQMVLGYQKEKIIQFLNRGETFVEQSEQLGTAHALKIGLNNLDNNSEALLVLCVDTPLLKKETIGALINKVVNEQAQVGILTAELENPNGYGRVVAYNGQVQKIVEDKDATPAERQIKEINAGVYYFSLSLKQIQQALQQIKPNNKQGEYYLTDLIEWANQNSLKVVSFKTEDPSEIIGINSRFELGLAINALNERTIKNFQAQGVTFIQSETSLVSPEAKIEKDATIWPGCVLLGETLIAEGSQIGPNAYIQNSKVGKNVSIRYSHVVEVLIEDDCTVGPYANLRPGTHLKTGAGIGDFVEVKNSTIGANSKVSHLSYIGDSLLGENVNIGAGTITANFDAISGEKNQTVLGDNVKVGSNSVFVAPIQIADGCMIGAGTVVTESVTEAESLILSRTPQVNKPEWVKKRKEGKQK